jgi:hypothetical protein
LRVDHADVEVHGPEGMFEDAQCAPELGLGIGAAIQALVERGSLVEAPAEPAVGRAPVALEHLERAPEKRLRLGVLDAVAIQVGQGAFRIGHVVRVQRRALPNLDCTKVVGLGLLLASQVALQPGDDGEAPRGLGRTEERPAFGDSQRLFGLRQGAFELAGGMQLRGLGREGGPAGVVRGDHEKCGGGSKGQAEDRDLALAVESHGATLPYPE